MERGRSRAPGVDRGHRTGAVHRPGVR